MHRPVKLFLCGDVMIGRGIDQLLPSPCAPNIYECVCTSALDYVALAERVNGPLTRNMPLHGPWGDALGELAAQVPDARIINLETAVTRSEAAWPRKGINYRVSPENAASLISLGAPLACSLANNHLLDWGYEGLADTTATLTRLGLPFAGAGATLSEAQEPAIIPLSDDRRVLVFAFGMASAGVPRAWAATQQQPGVNLLADLSAQSVSNIAALVKRHRRASNDVVVLSIHWGSNWDYEVTATERQFAHRLVDEAGVDLVHGHSSHHIKGLEVHNGKLIMYGAGDWINDYEGISGDYYAPFRGDLALMYFPTIDPHDGKLLDLTMTPTTVRRMQIQRVREPEKVSWIRSVLNREGGKLAGTRVTIAGDGRLRLEL